MKFNNFFAFIFFQSNQRMVEIGLIWWQWNYETKVNEENIEQLFRQFRRTFTKLQYSLRKMWKGSKWLIDVKLCKWSNSVANIFTDIPTLFVAKSLIPARAALMIFGKLQSRTFHIAELSQMQNEKRVTVSKMMNQKRQIKHLSTSSEMA